MNNYLSEAFKKLDILDEDVFELDKDGLTALKDFEDSDEDDMITVVDPDAESEEDLEDSYIGKVILDCSVCHTDIYKDKEDITIDEESGLANIGEECPYCYSSDGFKVIGEVKPFVEVEVDTDDDVDVEVDGEEVEKNESLRRKSRRLKESKLKEDFDRPIATMGLTNWSGIAIYDLNEEEVTYAFVYGNEEPVKETASIEYDCEDEDCRPYFSVEGERYYLDDFMRTSFFESKHHTKIGRKSLKEGWRSTPVKIVSHGSWGDPDLVWNGYTFNYWDVEDDMWGLFLEETGHKDSESNDPKVEAEFDEFVNDRYEDYFNELIWSGYFEEGSKSWHDRYKRESLKNRKSRKMKESIEDIKIDTGDQEISVSAKDKEKIESDGEMIAPLSDEVKADIETGSDDTVDVDVDDFSEEDFDELGESYLKKVYENVDGYKTTSAKSKGNKLYVEGLIKFNSGKQKKTSFVFESRTITKTGKAKLIGENLQISRGHKSFKLTGTINNGKFISESLNYNYRVKNGNESQRVYGTTKKSK